jgi:hypothetical protein
MVTDIYQVLSVQVHASCLLVRVLLVCQGSIQNLGCLQDCERIDAAEHGGGTEFDGRAERTAVFAIGMIY